MRVPLEELIYRDELIERMSEFFEGIKQRGCLSIEDVRFLCEKGIPAVEIAVKNITIKDFEKGINKWCNGI